jgi:phytoene dehydrogenase-like protein
LFHVVLHFQIIQKGCCTATGLAGLACGLQLAKNNVSFRILEASDGVGGRVRTDSVDGFLLDRGFQIFLTSYPEAQAVLDFKALDLPPFYAGAAPFCTTPMPAQR